MEMKIEENRLSKPILYTIFSMEKFSFELKKFLFEWNVIIFILCMQKFFLKTRMLHFTKYWTLFLDIFSQLNRKLEYEKNRIEWSLEKTGESTVLRCPEIQFCFTMLFDLHWFHSKWAILQITHDLHEYLCRV